MATAPAPTPLIDPATHAARWIADYGRNADRGDVMRSGEACWTMMLEELANAVGDDLSLARERVQRHAEDIGTGFRIVGEQEERPWPVSPIPLLIGEEEWAGIAAGVAQRAALMEAIVADLYGAQRLVSSGHIPAALVNGSPFYMRPLVGLEPPGGHHLHFVAIDLARGPDGEWRVLGDHLRAPAGAGYALENRLAMTRTLGGLQSRLNIQRQASFFAAFRDGLAAACKRSEPRLGLLTPGRYNPSYTEQAHLARYLGLLLVEGADLAVLEDKLYVRTIAGLKRIDALWRRVDPRLLDPLAFDSHSTIGVPGLVDAIAGGNVVIANSPGAAALEAPAFHAFMPGLATRLTGAELKIPNIATWWCGQDSECAEVQRNLDHLLIGPAFHTRPLGLGANEPVPGADIQGAARDALLADMARRPQDYIGQEIVHLSTMPVVTEDRLIPRPFTLRVFAARGGDGEWTVMPGGFARIGEHADIRASVMGEGSWSADVAVHGTSPVAPISLLASPDSAHIRRNPGTLPSRVADNFFWLGRYLERGEALLAVIRVMLGNSIDMDTGAAVSPETLGRLVGIVTSAGAAPHPPSLKRNDLIAFARTAMEADEGGWYSVRAINRIARAIGGGSRDRLSADMIRLLDAPFPTSGGILDRAGTLQRRYAAMAGLTGEHMSRTAAWRFQDLGRRVERASAVARAVRTLGMPDATSDDLSTLLDLCDSQISYRQRYLTGIARLPVVDLVALDPGNPRAIAYQAQMVLEHLKALPVLDDDGMAEPQQAEAVAINALISTTTAQTLSDPKLREIEIRLTALSDLIARRYFLHGAEPLRASGLTLA
ncbi:MAG: circularly permuted type 2 ATP-grasp protein [Sphingomonas sp.]|jgi:uncharacterized circularly permuted ATP-grasp superfamily protein/uncharacterized alpha-E superfamily protein